MNSSDLRRCRRLIRRRSLLLSPPDRAGLGLEACDVAVFSTLGAEGVAASGLDLGNAVGNDVPVHGVSFEVLRFLLRRECFAVTPVSVTSVALRFAILAGPIEFPSRRLNLEGHALGYVQIHVVIQEAQYTYETAMRRPMIREQRRCDIINVGGSCAGTCRRSKVRIKFRTH